MLSYILNERVSFVRRILLTIRDINTYQFLIKGNSHRLIIFMRTLMDLLNQ